MRYWIAFSAVACLPERVATPAVAEEVSSINEFFDAWLDQHLSNKYQVLGRVLYLRELVCLMVFKDRESIEDWELNADRIRALAGKLRSSGKADRAQMLETKLKDIDGQSAMWVTASQSWLRICGSPLSNERIEAWFDKAP